VLKQCTSGCFTEAIDFRKTLSVYNLCYWLNDLQAYVFLDSNAVAVVDVSGCFKIYAEDCGGDLVKKLRWALGVDENLEEFFTIARKDRLLKGFAEEFRGWRPRASSLWWALLVAHCQKATTFKQGWGILHRIVNNYGREVFVEGKRFLRPPKPEEVLQEPEKLIKSGAGFRAEGILKTAEALASGALDSDKLSAMLDSDVERQLLQLPHVGSYVARLAMILAFRRYSLPPVDRWVTALVSKVYGVARKASTVEAFLKSKWGRWAGLAVYAMTIALDAQPLSMALKRVEEGATAPKKGVEPSPLNMAAFCRG
jgi:N-glycosylase/DNA lyase